MNAQTLYTTSELSLLLVKNQQHSSCTHLMQVLLETGLRLLVADGADQGETLFEAELPDYVFICMDKGLDPFALTRRLRERWGCRAHVVIVGGDNSVVHWKKAFEVGAAACLPDPDDRDELEAVLKRLQNWMITTCADTSQQLLELSRATNLLESLPLGVMLLGHGEQILYVNHAAEQLSGVLRSDIPLQLDPFFLQLYGAGYDANLFRLRCAIQSREAWHDIVYCTRNGKPLNLELYPLSSIAPGDVRFHLLTLQDISRSPTAQPYQTMLSAAAFDLLFSRRHTTHEQYQLAGTITEGILPVPESFRMDVMLAESLKQVSTKEALLQVDLPEYLNRTYTGQKQVLHEVLAALHDWSTGYAGDSIIKASVALQGREADRYCLRFSFSIHNQRLVRSSYQRGDEMVAQHLYQSGNASFKLLHGLGLAATLLSLMGSTLIMKTVAFEGQTVLFDLWLKQEASQQEAAVPVPQPDPAPSAELISLWNLVPEQAVLPGTMRILVAEDNPLEQHNIKQVMEQLGHQVIMVGNGREAVEEAEHNQFDLILMDILMPVLDGFEAVRLIRQHERLQGSQTPIIALTSYSLKAVQDRCARAGMNGYLPKPVTRSKLDELLGSLSGITVNQEQLMQSIETKPVAAVLNLAEMLENLDSDTDFYNELLELFRSHGCELMDEILKRLQSEEPATGIMEQAHKMKGIASTVGAHQMAAVCLRIQEEEQLADRAVRTRYAVEFSAAQTALLSELNRIGWKVS